MQQDADPTKIGNSPTLERDIVVREHLARIVRYCNTALGGQPAAGSLFVLKRARARARRCVPVRRMLQ
jgi:hypothetical protein